MPPLAEVGGCEGLMKAKTPAEGRLCAMPDYQPGSRGCAIRRLTYARAIARRRLAISTRRAMQS